MCAKCYQYGMFNGWETREDYLNRGIRPPDELLWNQRCSDCGKESQYSNCNDKQEEYPKWRQPTGRNNQCPKCYEKERKSVCIGFVNQFGSWQVISIYDFSQLLEDRK